MHSKAGGETTGLQVFVGMFILGPVLSLGVTPAFGESISTPAQSALEFNQDRINAVRATGPNGLISRNFFVSRRAYYDSSDAGGGGGPAFSFSVTNLSDYNSNAETLPTGGSRTFEDMPDFNLAFQNSWNSLGGLQLSGSVDASLDRFSHSNGADADAVATALELQHVSGSSDQEFQPFVAFSTNTLFVPTFSKSQGTVTKLAIGFDKVFNFGTLVRNGPLQQLPLNQAGEGQFTSLQFGFSGKISKVFGAADREYVLKLSPSITYNWNNGPYSDADAAHWSLSAALNISRTWDVTATGAHEADWTLSPVVTLVFDPPASWFPKGTSANHYPQASAGNPTITLQVGYNRFTSNVQGKNYEQWALGPSVGLNWKF
jgi:hypothetical protein